jgi:hypothetical protein
MDLNIYMEELRLHEKAIEKLQERFLMEVGNNLLSQFKNFDPDCVWFTFDEKSKELHDISINDGNGRPILTILGDYPEKLTGLSKSAFNTILNTFKRKHFTVSKPKNYDRR